MTGFAIRNDRVMLVVLAVVLAAGAGTYGGMSRSEDPGFLIRTAVVNTAFPGASPARVEQLVTDKLEKTIQEIPEIDFLSSESRTGISTIYVNVKESETDLQPIWDKLRRKVDRARGDLPDGIAGPFVNDEFGDVFGTVLAVTGEGYS